MQRASRLIAAALPLAWVACQGPTAVRAIAYTEVPCDQQAPVSLVVASDLADLNAKLAAGIVSSTRTGCVEGLVGDVVVTPPGAIDGPIAFALLTRADGQTPDRCGDPSLPPSDRSQCIVAKRALRFRSHEQVDVRIDLRGACRGIACSAEQTCVQGACVSAQVSSVCAGGCTETDLAVDAGLNPVTCDVPISAPDTSKPTTIVGTGAGTCTEAALASAVAKGGTITFNCGDHATLAIGKTLSLRTDVDTIIDGGGKVTLDGGGKVRIMSFEHPDFRKNDVKLTLMRLSLSHGKAAGTDAYAAAPAPCSQGFYDGFGGALSFRDGVLAVFDTVFDANVAEALGPDVGGGAISIHGAKKVTIAGSTFRNGSGSNGGAIESLNSELDVYNSVFEDNVAVGNGTNLNDPSKCSVVDKNGQYQTGSGGNGGAISINGGSDVSHTFCGLVFRRNKAGAEALGGAISCIHAGAREPNRVDRSTFDGNFATAGGGGALYFHDSVLSITASTFAGNKANGCGAIQSDNTTVDFSNDTFSANEATGTGGVGGALCLFSGDGKLRNLTFSGNRADGFGAAIFGNPTLSIDNSLFAGNVGQNPGAPMQCQVTATGQGNLQFPRNHAVGGGPDAPCAAAITFADPMLSALALHGGPTQTMLPNAGSPALGLGSSCPAGDQRGVARPGQGCTSGAAEGIR